MKKFAIFSTLLVICLAATSTAFGQPGCEFNITGTWKADTTSAKNVVLYRFAADGTVTVLTLSEPAAEPQEIARATYEVDDPKAPKSITLTTTSKNRVFLYGKSSMKVLEYTEASLTCELPGYERTRWIRVEPDRHFIVLAARNGEFYDTSGSAFPILVKVVGRESQVDAVGIYSNQGKQAFGTVPPPVYKDFLREPKNDSEVMLRLEISAAQYERGLKVLRTWERRVRNGELLYPLSPSLNNVLLVKAVTETLNQCSEEFKLYKLNYLTEDWITERYSPEFIPFAYFKELRRMNEPLHVRDDKFRQATQPATPAQGH